MTDKTLRYLVAAAIAMLVVFQVGVLAAGLFGVVWGILSAVVVMAVSFYATRMAQVGVKNTFWFLLPSLLFTVLPVVYMVYWALTEDVGWFDRLARLLPFMIGFVVPVGLLLIVYYELRKRVFD